MKIPADRLVSRSDCHAVGVGDRAIRDELSSGRWARIVPGSYWTGRRAPAGVVAAVVAEVAGPDAVVSHHTAAAVHGLWAPSSTSHRATVPAGSNHSTLSVVVHRSRHAPASLRLRSRWLRWTPAGEVALPAFEVTDPVTTLLDLAAVVPRHEAAWAVARALGRGSVTLQDLRTAAAVRKGRGAARARRCVDDAEPRCRSVLEQAALLVIRDAGLPEPEVNHLLRRADGSVVAELDFWFTDGRLDVEIDGAADHDDGTPGVMRDRERQNRIASEGITVLRFTWRDIMHRPKWVQATIRAALAGSGALRARAG